MLGGVHEDHRYTYAPGRAGSGEFRFQQARYRRIFDTFPEQLPGPIGRFCAPARFRISRIRYHREGFREKIAPFPDRFARAGHMEKHPAVGIETVFVHKINTRFRAFQPLLPWFHSIVQRGEQPGRPAMEPY
ncbi:hypothetical protein D3C87_1858110 [compost metagenome]